MLQEEFKKLYPNCKDPKEWVQAMNELFPIEEELKDVGTGRILIVI